MISYYIYDLDTQEKEALISINDTDLNDMQEKRRKDQILAQILTLCREGASKTMIVYQVNLNFHTVMTYLGLLIKKDLLEVIPGYPVIYKTTAEGEIALESLKAVEAIYS